MESLKINFSMSMPTVKLLNCRFRMTKHITKSYNGIALCIHLIAHLPNLVPTGRQLFNHQNIHLHFLIFFSLLDFYRLYFEQVKANTSASSLCYKKQKLARSCLGFFLSLESRCTASQLSALISLPPFLNFFSCC